MEPHTVGTPSTFGYVDQELIVKREQVDAISLHFGLGAEATVEHFGGLTRCCSPKLSKVYDRLAELTPDLAGAVAPNYTLQPWVSSGGAGWPEPSTVAPGLAKAKSDSSPVAVFDSGLIRDYAAGHPQLGRTTPGTGPSDLVPDRDVMKLFDCHGTFVAGVLGCAAPGADILVRRVFDDDGGTDDWSLANTIHAFLRQNPRVRVVNLSCGTFADPAHPPLALLEVIKTMHPGVLFVAAAGNLPDAPATADRGHPTTTINPTVAGAEAATGPVAVTQRGSGATVLPAYPAAFDEVIGVGSALPNGEPAPWTDQASTDVWALGVDIHNAFGTGMVVGPPGADPVGPFAGKATWRGTSFAAPLAAGLLTGFAPVDKLSDADPPIARLAIDWLRLTWGRAGDPTVPIRLPYPAG